MHIGIQTSKLVFAALAAVTVFAPAHLALAERAAPATCGYHSGNFARTCSANITTRCFAAANRGVPGITKAGCAKHQATCTSCLGAFQTCLKTIKVKARLPAKISCERCAKKFELCITMRSNH